MSDVLREWEDFDRANSGLVAEAAGWGAKIDQSDDEDVLRWAREYLPRILAASEARPHRVTA